MAAFFGFGWLRLLQQTATTADWAHVTQGYDEHGQFCGSTVASGDDVASVRHLGHFVHWCSIGDKTRWDTPVCVTECPVAGETPSVCGRLGATGDRSFPGSHRIGPYCFPAFASGLANTVWSFQPSLFVLVEVLQTPSVLVAVLLLAAVSAFTWVVCLRLLVRSFSSALLGLGSAVAIAFGTACLSGRGATGRDSVAIGAWSVPELGIYACSVAVAVWICMSLRYGNIRQRALEGLTIQQACEVCLGRASFWWLALAGMALRCLLLTALAIGAALLLSPAKVTLMTVDFFDVPIAGVVRSFELTGGIGRNLLYFGVGWLWAWEFTAALLYFLAAHGAAYAHFAPFRTPPPALRAAMMHMGSLVLGSLTQVCLFVPRFLGLAAEFGDVAYADMVITASPFFTASLRASTVIQQNKNVLREQDAVLRFVITMLGMAYASAIAFGVVFSLSVVYDEASVTTLARHPGSGATLAVLLSSFVYSITAFVFRVADAFWYFHAVAAEGCAAAESLTRHARMEQDVEFFVDPISQEVMTDPVVAADGHTYERRSIAHWLRESDCSPLTKLPLKHLELVPNRSLRRQILESRSTPTSD